MTPVTVTLLHMTLWDTLMCDLHFTVGVKEELVLLYIQICLKGQIEILEGCEMMNVREEKKYLSASTHILHSYF